ncbi:MAG: aspartate ammonia-lyase [Nitrososphaera sp.]|uniref:aspartate ammonia-lyase n=1 Tax=Nitrososphaera sp. TaxID=1971748 RepID=UPI003D6E82D8
MSFRIDKDSLGEVKVPSGAYYGAFSARAKEQYRVTGQPAHANLVMAFVMIKRSAALANKELKALDAQKADAIVKACDEILAGKLHDQFVVEAINSGAGTAFNMNTNEVIANRALEVLGKKKGDYETVSPNDHVNMSQSSNDTFPTAMHVAILLNMEATDAAITILVKSLRKKAHEFKDAIKIGRTHVMDAIPVTLGAEFEEYAYSIERAQKKMREAMGGLREVGLGGTAVGTGANAPRGYRALAIKRLSEVSKLKLEPSENMFYSLQSKFDVAICSSALRNLAIELTKMANDIRLMASGPTAGLAEVLIPAVHAGSSIMPGKVNPSLAECLNMVCFNVMGNDVSVAMAAQAGQFELNVMLPGMLKCVLDSTDMLKNFLPIFAANMVDGLRANKDRLESYVEKSPVLVTLLNPYIGYLKAAEIYKESLKTGKSIRELVLEKKLMTKAELDKALSKDSILGSG